jgi:hypothetical protein
LATEDGWAQEVAALEELLAGGQFSDLLGREESAVLEVKGSKPYDLDSPFGRWELAKDVSAMANSVGGFLLVGLQTTKDPASDSDSITALDLIQETEFSAQKYTGIIKEYVYGTIAGLSANWRPQSPPTGVGLGVVYVPPQAQDAKPFLISQLTEVGKKFELVFGLVARRDAHNMPKTASELRTALREGNSTVSQRLTEISDTLDRLDTRLSESVTVAGPESSAGLAVPAKGIDPLASAIERIIGA